MKEKKFTSWDSAVAGVVFSLSVKGKTWALSPTEPWRESFFFSFLNKTQWNKTCDFISFCTNCSSGHNETFCSLAQEGQCGLSTHLLCEVYLSNCREDFLKACVLMPWASWWCSGVKRIWARQQGTLLMPGGLQDAWASAVLGGWRSIFRAWWSWSVFTQKEIRAVTTSLPFR